MSATHVVSQLNLNPYLMAYIVDYAITENAAGGATSVTANVPDHQADDYLIMFGTVNGAGVPSVTGWTQIGTTQSANSSGITSAVWYVKATTSTTTCTVSISVADDYTIKVVSIRDADLTTFLDGTPVSSNSGTTAGSSFTSPTFSTTQADSLIIYFHGLDGTTPMAHTNAGTMFLVSSDSTGTTAQTSAGSAIAWYIQRDAGTIPAASWVRNASAQRTNHVFAIRNKSGGRIPAYIDDSTTQATLIHAGFHTGTLNNTVVTTTMTATASINGKTMGTSTGTLGADFGINPYSSGLGNTSAIVAAGNLNGYQITLTGNRNWSTGLVIGNFIARTPKEARYGIGSTKQGGLVVRIGSGASNWCAYQVGAKDAVQSLETRSLFAIKPGYTTTSYGTPGSAINTSAVSFIQFYYNAPLFASIAYQTDLYQVFNTVVAGGDATTPVDIDGLAEVGISYRLPLIRKSGSAVLSYTPIQIGGGDAVNFQVNLGTIQFPGRYNAAARDLSYHAGDNEIGISFSAKSGDVCKLTNSVITSPNSYYFTINAAATSAATWDFSGTTVVGAAVTLRPVTTFSSMTFSGATAFTTNASTISNSSIISSVEVVAAGATFTGVTFRQTTGANGAVSITGSTQSALQAELDRFTNCQFTSNTSTGALRIIYTGTAGPITLNMSSGTFSGNTADIRWEAPASSNLTINVSGTANPGTSSATNSNTVTFVNTKTFIVTNIIDGSEVRIFRQSDLVELGGAELVGASPSGLSNVSVSSDPDNAGRYRMSYSYNYVSDVPVYVVCFHVNYQALRPAATLKSTDSSLQVAQITDRQYDIGSIP